MRRTPRIKRPTFLLAAITLLILLAAALRFHLLGAQSLWNDEGNSYVQAIRPFADIAANAGLDIHPPGYYWLLAIWRLLAGTSEFALRSLSVFASLLSITFAYALGRRLYGTVAGFSAALLITLNTFNIYYAQEARMYALLALWSAASFWALAGFFQRRTPRWAVALAIFNAAGLWTQYAYPFVMIAQGIVALVWLIAELRRGESETRLALRAFGWYVLANLLTILLYAAWLPTAIRQLTTWPNTGDATPIPEALNTIFQWLAFGMASPGAALAIPGVLMLFGLLVIARRTLWQALIPPLWVVVPLGIFLLLGMYRPDNVKLLLPAQIGLALWIGRGIWVLWTLELKYGRKRDFAVKLARYIPPATAVLSAAWLALIAVDGIAPLYGDPAFQRADYRAIVREIEGELRSGDAIILDAPNQDEVFRYYYDGEAPVYPLPAGLGGDDEATIGQVEAIIAEYERVFAVFWGENERDPQRIVEGTLDQQAYEVSDTWYGDVRLARYVMPVEPQVLREAGVGFGDEITLERYSLSEETPQTGEVVQVTLRWQTDAPLEERYKVFVQALDENGVLVAQRDSEPGGGLQPTTVWVEGETVVDRHALALDVAAGEYKLIVGMYALDDPTARLPVHTGGDYFELATITVTG